MKTPKHTLKRKERDDEPYEVSRWTPLVKDLIQVKAKPPKNLLNCPVHLSLLSL